MIIHVRAELVYLLLIVMLALTGGSARAQREPASRPLQLKVVGTQIVNSRNEPVWLRGVNAASMEWTSDGEGHILDTVKTAIQDWHVNIIRLPMAQDRWFGKAPEQKDEGKDYRALIKQVVDYCASHGCYILLDLHWSDAGEWGQQIGQHAMPDKNSVVFWKECARAYRNNPAVLFDLYNEPHDVSWDVWLNGGTVTEHDRQRNYTKTYDAVGMQTLLDTVRGTGAKNVVVAGGLDWAYDMSGFLTGKPLSDPKGNGVIYANHDYPFKGDTFDQWLAKMEKATASIPVIVSEFGAGGGPRRRQGQSGDQWILQVLQALQEHHWNWIAWDLHPSAGPTLISDWNYTPTPHFGIYVKEALAGNLPPLPPPTVPSPSPPAPAAPVPQVATTVLDKAIKALGGEEALSKVKAASWKTQTKLTFNGNESEATGQEVVEGLDHIRQEFAGEFGGNKVKGVTILAGDKGARLFGDNRTEMGKDEIANQKRTAYLTVIPMVLLPLKDKAFKIESVADATVDGKPAAGIKVTAPDQKDFTLYFDKETGLPVKSVADVVGFTGEEFTQETTYGDYKPAAGILKAMKIALYRDGEKFMEQQITEFKVLDTVDPKTFTEIP